MEKNTTISEFLKTKEITIEELNQNFQLAEKIDVDMINYNGCPHCKINHINQRGGRDRGKK